MSAHPNVLPIERLRRLDGPCTCHRVTGRKKRDCGECSRSIRYDYSYHLANEVYYLACFKQEYLREERRRIRRERLKAVILAPLRWLFYKQRNADA